MRHLFVAIVLSAVPSLTLAQTSGTVSDAELQAILDRALAEKQSQTTDEHTVGYSLPLEDVPLYVHPEGGVSTHTVIEGDTLYGLSQRYGVTIAAIQQSNALTDYALSLGDRVIIPAKPTVAPTSAPIQPSPVGASITAAHIVQPGDTLYGISRAYCVKADALFKANPALKPTTLQIGAQVRLPSGHCTPKIAPKG